MLSTKCKVHDFWNSASCGESLYLVNQTKEGYIMQAAKRNELEPMIKSFAEFSTYQNKEVLEIGVGLGAEHQQFAEVGAKLTGIDLTERAISHTKHRLALFGLTSHLQVTDAENLPFKDSTFDLVYFLLSMR